MPALVAAFWQHQDVIDLDDLVHRVALRAASESDQLAGGADAQRIEQAQQRLGFALHPLLARLYREVADGGFGPEYQLLPLLGPGPSVVGEYLVRRQASAHAEHPQWPEGVVPIMTWGCGMYAAVDCLSVDGQVLLFEPNPYSGGPWDECWFLDAQSLAAWLETWLTGMGWYEQEAVDRGDLIGPQPWEQSEDRLSGG